MGNLLAAFKVLALVIFIALGFSIGTGSMSHLHEAGGAVAPAGWLLSLVPVMFTYSGWNAAGYVAEEIRDPGRNVPRAFALGTVAVVAIYLSLNLLYLYVLPVGDLARVRGSVLDLIADRLLGARAGNIMGVVSIVSLAASISAMTFAGPRVYYAMARDGLFFPSAARVHPRFRTPAISIVSQGAWSALLVLSGSAGALTRYTGFAVVLFAGVAVVALFVLRAREPGAPRPFSAIGYPVAPALFAVASLAIVVNAIYTDPGPAGAGLAVIAAGVPLYVWLTHGRRLS
jgi:APA family basic amino acid/polyamine antiporter